MFLGFSAFFAFYIIYDNQMWNLDSKKANNIQEKLAFLQQNKNIAEKDFTTILESIMPKKEIPETKENLAQTQPKKEDTSQKEEHPKDELTLYAIIDNHARINAKWHKVGDVITDGKDTYTLKSVGKFKITLINTATKEPLTLEMFAQSPDLIIEEVK